MTSENNKSEQLHPELQKRSSAMLHIENGLRIVSPVFSTIFVWWYGSHITQGWEVGQNIGNMITDIFNKPVPSDIEKLINIGIPLAEAIATWEVTSSIFENPRQKAVKEELKRRQERI